jgi:hypothetical protein
MLADNCFVWNVRGLNGCACRNVVRDLVSQERATLVCLQETKLSNVCNSLANETLGGWFDYDFLPSVTVAGAFYWDGTATTGRCQLSTRDVSLYWRRLPVLPVRMVVGGSRWCMVHRLIMTRSNSWTNCYSSGPLSLVRGCCVVIST